MTTTTDLTALDAIVAFVRESGGTATRAQIEGSTVGQTLFPSTVAKALLDAKATGLLRQVSHGVYELADC